MSSLNRFPRQVLCSAYRVTRGARRRLRTPLHHSLVEIRSASHARQIVVRLLKALVEASGPPLKVAELEGDAVFFFAPSTEGTLAKDAAAVKGQILRFFRPGSAGAAKAQGTFSALAR